MEEKQVPVPFLVTPSCWHQQHTGTEQGMALPSFLRESVGTEAKGVSSPRCWSLGFWLVTIQSSASLRTGAGMVCSGVLYGLELSPKSPRLRPQEEIVPEEKSTDPCHRRQSRCVLCLCGGVSLSRLC